MDSSPPRYDLLIAQPYASFNFIGAPMNPTFADTKFKENVKPFVVGYTVRYFPSNLVFQIR